MVFPLLEKERENAGWASWYRCKNKIQNTERVEHVKDAKIKSKSQNVVNMLKMQK